MAERKDYVIDTSKIKTIEDVGNIFKCLGIICDISLLGENDPKYELVKEYFVIPYVEEPHKSIEEIQQEFENTLDELLVKTKRKFAVSKESAEYRFKLKSDQANSRFEYAKTYGYFAPSLTLITTGTGITASNYDWRVEFKTGPSSVGYYLIEPNFRICMQKKPNRIVQFFMRNLLGLKWVDEK
jgi:hypothetical protein